MSVDSPGRKAVVQCTSDLTSLLKHHLSCSGKLLEKGLITEAVHDWTLTAPAVSNQQRAARLVSCLADRVGGSSQLFHELVQALKEIDPFYGDIVDKLTSLYSSFSALRIANEEEKKQVGATIDKLEKQFSSLQKRLSMELTAKSEVSPEILLESLTLLPVALRSEYQKFILENLSTLRKADSIREFFFYLNPHISFIDYHLVEYLVEEFASRRLKNDMSVYVAAVQVFYDETAVQQLMDHWPGRCDIPPHFEELRAVIDEDPGTFTLRRLDNLRKEFCSEIQFLETVLILKRFARKNSFVVCWVVPSIFVPQLKSVMSRLRSFCHQREHIFSVTVGTQRLYSIAAEYEERLLFLCSSPGAGDMSEFQYLLSQPGLETNIYDKRGYTPLYYASEQGRNDLIQLLIEHGAMVDLPTDDEWGSTPLTGACIGGKPTTAALLIEKGAKVNYITKDDLETESKVPSIEDKTRQVGATIDNLEKQFSSLQQRLSAELTAKSEVSPEILLESLTLLPIALRNEYQKFILENLSTLEKADSIRKIFFHLNPHFSFIDYHLIKYLVEEFASSQLKGDMSVYVEAVQVFLDETTVLDLMDHWPGRPDKPPHFEELRAVIDGDPSKYTLRQLDHLRKRFCSETGLSEVVLSLIGVERKNSFIVRCMFPCIKGNPTTATLLIEKEAKKALNPLYGASFHGNLECVKVLLDRGAQIDLPSNDHLGFTALGIACQQGHVDVARLFIERGAAIDYQNKVGVSPLCMASMDGHDDIVQLLIERGASIDLPNKDEYCLTSLCVACQVGHVNVVKTLISNGADVNHKSKDARWSPLLLASYGNHTDVLELLIKHNVQLDDANTAGLTALMLATQSGHASAVQMLLDGKGDPNITDKTFGWTALFFAIEKNSLEIIEMLIKGGARLDIKDNNGLVAFEVAKAHNQKAVCNLLKKHGSKTTEKEITQEQREQIKATSQRLRKVLAFLERTLLREKTKKMEQQQPEPGTGGGRSSIFQWGRQKQLEKTQGTTIHTDNTTKVVSQN